MVKVCSKVLGSHVQASRSQGPAEAEAGQPARVWTEIDAEQKHSATDKEATGVDPWGKQRAAQPWPATAWAGRRGACVGSGPVDGTMGVKAGADKYGDGTNAQDPRATDSKRRLSSSFS